MYDHQLEAMKSDLFHYTLGMEAEARDDYETALLEYGKALENLEHLIADNHDSSSYQHMRYDSLIRIAVVQREQNRPDAATNTFRQAAQVMERLSLQEPANDEWKRELASQRENIAGLIRDSDPQAAVGQCEKALVIRQELFEYNLGDAGHMRSLALSYWNMAICYRLINDEAKGPDQLMNCYGVLRGAQALGIELGPQEEDIYRRLEPLFRSQGF